MTSRLTERRLHLIKHLALLYVAQIVKNAKFLLALHCRAGEYLRRQTRPKNSALWEKPPISGSGAFRVL